MSREVLRISGNIANDLIHPLNRMLTKLFEMSYTGSSFGGQAYPADSDPNPSEPTFWLAGPGTYTNYGGLVVPPGSIGYIVWDGTGYTLLVASVTISDIVHGELSELSADDHPQYHNNTRGDARYLKRDGSNDAQGNLNMNDYRITTLQNPSGNYDAINKIWAEQQFAKIANVLTKDNVTPYEPSADYHPVTVKKLTDEINAVQAGNLFIGYFATQTELNNATYTYSDVNIFSFGTPVMRGTHNESTLYMPGSVVLYNSQYYVLTKSAYTFGAWNASEWTNIIAAETIYYNGRIFLFTGAAIEEKPYTKNGSYAIVEQTDTVWVYDADTGTWSDSGDNSQVSSVNGQTGAVVLNTDNIAEGSANKYINATQLNYINQLFNFLTPDSGDFYVSTGDLYVNSGRNLVIYGSLRDSNNNAYPLASDILTTAALSGYLQTADLLSGILAIDGPASGINADLLDGQHGSYYATSSALATLTGRVSQNETDIAANAAAIPTTLAELDTTVTGSELNALKIKLDGIEAGATADQIAAEVPYSNINSGLVAQTVQAAIDELEAAIPVDYVTSDELRSEKTRVNVTATATLNLDLYEVFTHAPGTLQQYTVQNHELGDCFQLRLLTGTGSLNTTLFLISGKTVVISDSNDTLSNYDNTKEWIVSCFVASDNGTTVILDVVLSELITS